MVQTCQKDGILLKENARKRWLKTNSEQGHSAFGDPSWLPDDVFDGFASIFRLPFLGLSFVVFMIGGAGCLRVFRS